MLDPLQEVTPLTSQSGVAFSVQKVLEEDSTRISYVSESAIYVADLK